MLNGSKTVRIVLCFCLGILLSGLLFACQPSENQVSVDDDCYLIEHAAGTTCVPNTVERLVTLDVVTFESAIALGIKPVGTTGLERLSSLSEDLENVADIGQSDKPNLESILSLNPDLILGIEDFASVPYDQVSQIAPTVLFKFEHSGLWKELFRDCSRALNREGIGQQAMEGYRQRIQDFRQRFEAQAEQTDISDFQVSVLRVYPDAVNFYFRDSFPGVVLNDAGFARPAFQDIDAAEAKSRYQNPIQASISMERLDQADADVLFVWTAEDEEKAIEAAQKRWETLQQNAIWQTLEVVQQEKAYFVPSYWIGAGPLAADAMIDDLFKYIVDDEQINDASSRRNMRQTSKLYDG